MPSAGDELLGRRTIQPTVKQGHIAPRFSRVESIQAMTSTDTHPAATARIQIHFEAILLALTRTCQWDQRLVSGLIAETGVTLRESLDRRQALRELRESFPAYEMTVITEDTRQLLRLLDSNEIDLAVGIEITESSRFHFHPMFFDHIALAMAPVHPLVTLPAPSRLELAEQNFIFYGRDSEAYRILEHYFTELNGKLGDYLQVGSVAAIKEMSKIGMGIGLLTPWIALEEITAGSLVFRRLPWKKADRVWGVYTDQHHLLQMIDDIFFGICQNVACSLPLRTEKQAAAVKM